MRTRIEEQEPPAAPEPPTWEVIVRTVEERGVELAMDAFDRFPNDSHKALHYVEHHWRLQPDETERAIRAEAMQTILASISLDARADAMLEAQRMLMEAA